MRKRTITTAAVCAAAVLTPTLPAEAAPVVRIRQVYFDSPGSDTGSNSSLNGEWFQIGNYGTTARSLKGWTVRDKAGHVYTFGTYTLGAKKIVTVRTGKGTNSTYTRYWGRAAYVWNNTGDTAYFRDASGKLIHSCSWTSTGSSKVC